MTIENYYIPIKKRIHYGNEIKLWLTFLIVTVPVIVSLLLMGMQEILMLFLGSYFFVLMMVILIMSYFIDENLFKTMFLHIKKYYLRIESPVDEGYSAKRRPKLVSFKLKTDIIGRRLKLGTMSCLKIIYEKTLSSSIKNNRN